MCMSVTNTYMSLHHDDSDYIHTSKCTYIQWVQSLLCLGIYDSIHTPNGNSRNLNNFKATIYKLINTKSSHIVYVHAWCMKKLHPLIHAQMKDRAH